MPVPRRIYIVIPVGRPSIGEHSRQLACDPLGRRLLTLAPQAGGGDMDLPTAFPKTARGEQSLLAVLKWYVKEDGHLDAILLVA